MLTTGNHLQSWHVIIFATQQWPSDKSEALFTCWIYSVYLSCEQ